MGTSHGVTRSHVRRLQRVPTRWDNLRKVHAGVAAADATLVLAAPGKTLKLFNTDRGVSIDSRCVRELPSVLPNRANLASSGTATVA